ncbi:MAG: riboflavin synthase [Clostridia bacterium]
MFTGIIEETGRIESIRRHSLSASLTVSCQRIMEDIHIGDSIAVNGICLTVTFFSGSEFTVDVMPETMDKTSLRQLKNGSVVNLERAMAANGRFGGHIVSGHIDGTGMILKIQENEIAVIFTIAASKELLDGIVPKGSVALDGISLTVVEVTDTAFSVSLIPHTRTVTNMREKGIGDPINIETDVIGKYVKKYVTESADNSSDTITMDFLAEKGFM